jgi:hypothetical protein
MKILPFSSIPTSSTLVRVVTIGVVCGTYLIPYLEYVHHMRSLVAVALTIYNIKMILVYL